MRQAHYRKAMALQFLQKHDAAIDALEVATTLLPSDKLLQEQLLKFKTEREKQVTESTPLAFVDTINERSEKINPTQSSIKIMESTQSSGTEAMESTQRSTEAPPKPVSRFKAQREARRRGN